MLDFLAAVRDPDLPFLRYALAAGALASVAFGVLGSYVVVRRIGYLAGAIAHSVLAGIGAALYLQHARGLAWCSPIAGALASGLLAAVAIGLVSRYARQREDTVIGAIWSVGMAVGLLFLAKTPGYIDAMSYLFGSILMVGRRDLLNVAALDALVVGVAALSYNRLLAVSFDEEFSALRGLRVTAYYLLLLCLTAVAVVLLMRVVGLVLVIALLTLPAAIAGQFARRLWQMMVLASALCLLCTAAGIGFSYRYDLPTGPTIILLAGAGYLLVLCAGHLRRRSPR